MVSYITAQIIHIPYFQRKSVYKWMAAVSLDLGEAGLSPVLHIMVPPLQRDINDQTTTLGL